MEVLLLTTLFSIVFAILFLSLFLRDRQLRDFGGVDREALLPLDDEGERRAETPRDVAPVRSERDKSSSNSSPGITSPESIS